MNPALAFLLAMTFLISIGGLFLLIWALANDQFATAQSAARTIFAEGEEGVVEDPALSSDARQAMQAQRDAGQHQPDTDELEFRIEADRSSRVPVLAWTASSVLWLLLGSLFGLLASLKLHLPELLANEAVLTFGRVRPAHLNVVAYGWASMAGVGVGLWLIPRLFKEALVGGVYATAGAVFWNLGMVAGTVAILAGHSDGLEWLEFPWQIDILLVLGGALAAVPLLLTLLKRRVHHLYVSSWYLVAALVWFPMLFITGNIPGLFSGVEQAAMNWWFAHNVLGLWMTPLGLAAAYYFIPKIVGAPVYSYSLSLLGFWALALFYSQVGMHHLIGGPVPTWLVTLSIVQSVMMFIPVLAVAINHHMTVAGHFRLLLYSPTLRFVTLGAMMYTFASVQGSLEALRSVNVVTHFTHYTVAHAHMGVYGFLSFILFGSIYFVMPRLMGWEWPYAWAISAHFWLVFIGFGIYFWPLSVGGWLQGLAMLDPARSFMESVTLTLPYLEARSVGGTLMTLGHLIFATHFFIALLRQGPERQGPSLLWRRLQSGEAT
ncbi:cbb3-type cytochrome c oxidase subunit I [Spectribacter hydrogenooxidans]|uniref:Cbb3-type cytochrome c oxidase subunit I n=1 Tax=Spectribacter hydrogenoxidans TaxID=3075608 RepID=A0ABU3BXV9_9GAMM|nr:cbb3-type cytochrome c oxidase subunit I [Salinisphaera sp. W335]MDT0634090.1 cbb3-type cytochrome c oxidase subunit I [Salinisphaera sp. W335]